MLLIYIYPCSKEQKKSTLRDEVIIEEAETVKGEAKGEKEKITKKKVEEENVEEKKVEEKNVEEKKVRVRHRGKRIQDSPTFISKKYTRLYIRQYL